MPKAKPDEEKKTATKTKVAAQVEGDGAKAESSDAAKKKVVKASADKPTRKPAAKSSDDGDEAAARTRAAASSARPSIYDTITASAKKAEADRAAKAAAAKEKATSQNAAKPAPAAGAAAPKKQALNPFLQTNLARAMPSALKPKTEPKPAAEPTPPAPLPAAPAPTATAQTPPPTAASSAPPTTAQPKVEPKKPTTQESAAPAPTAAPHQPRTQPTPRHSAPSRQSSAPTATSSASAPVAQPRTFPKPQQRPPQRSAPSRAPARAPARVEPVAPKPVAPPVPVGPVSLPATLTVRDLAPLLHIPIGDMMKKLMSMGIFATINQTLDYDTASLIAEEFEIETKPAEVAAPSTESKPAAIRTAADSDKAQGQIRPPVVTVLGHVDHGKTSLLDAIRNAKVAAGEAGGITQHIGAYQIEKQGRKITFLDTPGHEAFTAMRARGAQMTDVAVLVVAADDGVMPQTKEAISHVRAANVPMVVALNKIDRETADQQRVMTQLSENGVVVEQYGGDVPLVPVSARKVIGIDELLDMILLVADLAEVKANPDRPAIGSVIEAQMDRNRGPVATLLVQNGTLRQNDYLVINNIQGRIRAMFDDRGNRLSEAGPSTPVLVLGLPSVPVAGDTFQVVADERTARNLAQQASDAAQAQARVARTLSLDELYVQMEAGKMHDLNIVLKADVQGSLEPIRNSLEKLSTENLKVRLLHQGMGNISESDVSLALASEAIVIGFHVDVDPAAKRLAASEGVDIRLYDIIYKLIEDVDKALKGLLEPTYKEVVSGRAEVRQVFKVSKRNVAGCYITEGKAVRSGQARLLRAGKVIFDGRIAALKRFTEDVREVMTGFECGVSLEGYEAYQQGDVIEFYHKEKEE